MTFSDLHTHFTADRHMHFGWLPTKSFIITKAAAAAQFPQVAYVIAAEAGPEP